MKSGRGSQGSHRFRVGADEDAVRKELVKLAEEKLSGFKKPKTYEFWTEELPRLPTGKFREILLKRFW